VATGKLHIRGTHGICTTPVQTRRGALPRHSEIGTSSPGGEDVRIPILTTIITVIGGILEAVVAAVIAAWSGDAG
jgi:hypothetical protein